MEACLAGHNFAFVHLSLALKGLTFDWQVAYNPELAAQEIVGPEEAVHSILASVAAVAAEIAAATEAGCSENSPLSHFAV